MKIRTKAPNFALTKEVNPAARPILEKFPNITRTINP
jgi:hypothetical protein